MDRLGYKVFKGHRVFQELLEFKVSQVQRDRKVYKEFKVPQVHWVVQRVHKVFKDRKGLQW